MAVGSTRRSRHAPIARRSCVIWSMRSAGRSCRATRSSNTLRRRLSRSTSRHASSHVSTVSSFTRRRRRARIVMSCCFTMPRVYECLQAVQKLEDFALRRRAKATDLLLDILKRPDEEIPADGGYDILKYEPRTYIPAHADQSILKHDGAPQALCQRARRGYAGSPEW